MTYWIGKFSPIKIYGGKFNCKLENRINQLELENNMENEIINFLLYSNIPPLIGLFVGCWVVVKRLDRFKSELIEKIDRVSEKIEIFRNELTEKIDLLKSELNEKIHSNETKIKKSTFP